MLINLEHTKSVCRGGKVRQFHTQTTSQSYDHIFFFLFFLLKNNRQQNVMPTNILIQKGKKVNVKYFNKGMHSHCWYRKMDGI